MADPTQRATVPTERMIADAARFAVDFASGLQTLKVAADAGNGARLTRDEVKAMIRAIRLGYTRTGGADHAAAG